MFNIVNVFLINNWGIPITFYLHVRNIVVVNKHLQ